MIDAIKTWYVIFEFSLKTRVEILEFEFLTGKIALVFAACFLYNNTSQCKQLQSVIFYFLFFEESSSIASVCKPSKQIL